MPTYEYACTDCGERIEVSQRITDPPLEVCEVCGGPLRKLFHPVGISFRGSGFYTTDSRPKRDGEGKPAEKKPEKKDGAKSDSSPAGTKEKTA
jgi:putative FmdB family regulatory protein